MTTTKSANGAAWMARRQGQANAARPVPNKARDAKRPRKAQRNAWKRGL